MKKIEYHPFYGSPKWRALRLVVLKLYTRRCMKCGKYPSNRKQAHVDHIKPRSLYPSLELDINNLQVLCKKHNKEKSNKSTTDYRTPEHLKKLNAYLVSIKETK